MRGGRGLPAGGCCAEAVCGAWAKVVIANSTEVSSAVVAADRDREDGFKPELDYYVLGQASKFLQPGAVRIASDEPAGTKLKDVGFRNTNGTVVLYTLNAGTASQDFRIGFHGKTAATTLPAGAVATFVWKP